MKYFAPHFAFGLSLLILATACETTGVPVEMDPAGYDELMRRAEQNPSPAATDRDLTALLQSGDLGDTQKAEAHYLRATKRWQGDFDKPGAVEDFSEFLRLSPTDPKAAQARTKRGYVQSEIRGHEQRLAGLQTLPTWFDDKVAMGALSEAAMRYKKSGLTPTDGQVYTLREAGYICTDASGGEAVHRYGALPAYAANLVWCPVAAIT